MTVAPSPGQKSPCSELEFSFAWLRQPECGSQSIPSELPQGYSDSQEMLRLQPKPIIHVQMSTDIAKCNPSNTVRKNILYMVCAINAVASHFFKPLHMLRIEGQPGPVVIARKKFKKCDKKLTFFPGLIFTLNNKNVGFRIF